MMTQLLFLIPLLAIAHGASTGIEPRIVGGRNAEEGEIPYQVSLQIIKKKHHFCGGVILNREYVLTAAHCMDGQDIREISVNVGMTDLDKPHAVHLVEQSYIHEDYSPRDSYVNDIALIKLQSPLEFNAHVSSVSLTVDTIVEAGSAAVVSGFGRLSFNGPASRLLKVVTIQITNQTYCQNVYGSDTMRLNVHDTQICATDPTGGHGSCQGDSGGPLTVNGRLIGLVSWARDCANKDWPTVFTRVPSFIPWIANYLYN